MLEGKVVNRVEKATPNETIFAFTDGTKLQIYFNFGENRYLMYDPESCRWSQVNPANIVRP